MLSLTIDKCAPNIKKECASPNEIDNYVNLLSLWEVNIFENVDWDIRGRKPTKLIIKPKFLSLDS